MSPSVFIRLACAAGLSCLLGPARAAEPTAVIAWPANAATGIATLKVQPPGAGASSGASAAVTLQGTVLLLPHQTEAVASPLAGLVQAVLVAPMDTVRAGQAIARIISPQLVQMQREWLTAETQARQAASRLERDERLLAEGIISEHRRNEARAQSEMATLAARERRQALRLAGLGDTQLQQAAKDLQLSGQITVLSTVSGRVLELAATPGQRIEAGALLARVGKESSVTLELQATPEQALALRAGDRFAVEGCTPSARLMSVSPQVSSGSQAVLLRAEMNNPGQCVRVNQYVQTRLISGDRAGTTSAPGVPVPDEALVQHQNATWVFVKQPQGLRATQVKVLGREDARQQRVQGLKAGDEVVVRGVAAVKGAWLGMGPEPATGSGKP
jgi:membrane fusion protein, heavy metal efflux system